MGETGTLCSYCKNARASKCLKFLHPILQRRYSINEPFEFWVRYEKVKIGRPNSCSRNRQFLDAYKIIECRNFKAEGDILIVEDGFIKGEG